MNAPLRNSNPASLHAASLACALVLSSLIFLVFPFSRCLSLRGACGAPQPSKKTFVELTPKKNEESAPKSGLKNIRVSNAPSPHSAVKIKIEIPASDFAKFAVEGAGGNSFFGFSEFAPEGASLEPSAFGVEAFEISELDFTPRCRKRGALRYPRKLFEKGVEGEVRLMVYINEDGSVELESVESFTHEDFLDSAKKSLKDLLYDVPTRGGKPARARFLLPITFKINRK
ncbi:MAG: TonB family protein [Opitutales bacterium]|nr:TonB family protein [Opitutales bacterium]